MYDHLVDVRHKWLTKNFIFHFFEIAQVISKKGGFRELLIISKEIKRKPHRQKQKEFSKGLEFL